MLTEVGPGANSSLPSRTARGSTPGGVRPGQTGAIRSQRSRKNQLNNILDHLPGYVLAETLGGFRFVSLRTPEGTAVELGHRALVHLRTGLARRFAYVARLELQPDLLDESLVYVRGQGWYGDYSLEASDNLSPHFHIMLAIFGYDPAEFESAIFEVWEDALTKFTNISGPLGPYDVHVGNHLGPETVRYMVGHKRTRRERIRTISLSGSARERAWARTGTGPWAGPAGP